MRRLRWKQRAAKFSAMKGLTWFEAKTCSYLYDSMMHYDQVNMRCALTRLVQKANSCQSLHELFEISTDVAKPSPRNRYLKQGLLWLPQLCYFESPACDRVNVDFNHFRIVKYFKVA